MKNYIKALTTIVLFFAFSFSKVNATTYTVINNNDAGAGSLRQAIADANANADADNIVFDAGVTGSIVLTSQLNISNELTITGPGAGILAINGNDVGRIFHILSGAFNVSISGLTITNGGASTGGGGLLILTNSGTTRVINISDCIISNNVASGTSNGGGILNSGPNATLNITNCTISGNYGNNAGGIINSGGTLNINKSTISGNTAGIYGGGIQSGGNTTITYSTISGNSCNGGGGAIDTYGGILNISHSTMANNNDIHSANINGLYLNSTTTLFANILENAGQNVNSIGGTFTSTGYNIEDANTALLNHANDIHNATGIIGPLANNGGSMLTHALLIGSPAKDKVGLTCGPTDQLGNIAPANGLCDIGALEMPLPTIACPTNISQNNDAGQCTAVVNYPLPTPSSAVLLAGLASGSTFPIGTSNITYGVPYSTSTYNFTGLTSGASISGQDGWLGASAGFSNVNTILANNYTPYANPQSSGLGLLGTAIGANKTSFATRKDNSNFSIPDFDPTGVMTIQFDARQTYWGNYFQFGYDVNNNGHLSGANEISFGVRYSNVNNNIDLLGVGGAVLASVSLASYSIDGYWRQIKLLIDKNANSGAGSISLSFRDVINNGPWIEVATLQNKIAGFNPSGTDASNPMNINGMVYSHEAGDDATSNSFLDNIIFTKYIACSFTVTVEAPEINVQGNSNTISDGDVTPIGTDGTDFGNITAGASGVSTFTIQNTGSATLNISSITSNNAAFVVSGAPTSITTGSSATFDVTFSPTAAGTQNATITINNDDCNEAVYDFAVKGNGIVAITSLSINGDPTSLLGSVATFTATLNRVSALAGPLSGQTVTFSIQLPNASIQSYSATTDANGDANITFTSPMVGTHSVNASFVGNASHAPSNSTAFTHTVIDPCTHPNYTFTGASNVDATDPSLAANWLNSCIPSMNDPAVIITVNSGKTFKASTPIAGSIVNNGTITGTLSLAGSLTNNGNVSPGN